VPAERSYPISCRSAYCGRTDCPSDCPFLPELSEFKDWKARTNAKQLDPIWLPGLFTAERD